MIKDVLTLEHKYQRISYRQQGEDLVLERILNRILKLPSDYIGFYLDIGAYHPVRHSVTYFLYKKGWAGICADINELSCELFRHVRSRDVTIFTAVGNRLGEVVAYFSPGQFAVTNTCDSDAAQKMMDKGLDVTKRNVPIITLNNILETHASTPIKKIDFLNIDVEGYEMDVLHGFDIDKYKPTVIATEIHARSINDGLNTPIASYLQKNNYRPVACSVITYFFVRNV